MESKWIPFEEAKALDKFYQQIEEQLMETPAYRDFFFRILTRILENGETTNS